jgi:hypothetical protein
MHELLDRLHNLVHGFLWLRELNWQGQLGQLGELGGGAGAAEGQRRERAAEPDERTSAPTRLPTAVQHVGMVIGARLSCV